MGGLERADRMASAAGHSLINPSRLARFFFFLQCVSLHGGQINWRERGGGSVAKLDIQWLCG